VHPLVCKDILGGEKVFLLKSITKDLAGFFSLVREGFPRIYFVFLCMVCLHVILVAATFMVMVNC
jgi:hypothetical protein